MQERLYLNGEKIYQERENEQDMVYYAVLKYTSGDLQGIKTMMDFDDQRQLQEYIERNDGLAIVYQGASQDDAQHYINDQDLLAACGVIFKRAQLASLDQVASTLMRAANSSDPRTAALAQDLLERRIDARLDVASMDKALNPIRFDRARKSE